MFLHLSHDLLERGCLGFGRLRTLSRNVQGRGIAVLTLFTRCRFSVNRACFVVSVAVAGSGSDRRNLAGGFLLVVLVVLVVELGTPKNASHCFRIWLDDPVFVRKFLAVVAGTRLCLLVRRLARLVRIVRLAVGLVRVARLARLDDWLRRLGSIAFRT